MVDILQCQVRKEEKHHKEAKLNSQPAPLINTRQVIILEYINRRISGRISKDGNISIPLKLIFDQSSPGVSQEINISIPPPVPGDHSPSQQETSKEHQSNNICW